MKKILTVAILLFMVIFTFTACEIFDFFDKVTGGEPHVHTYAEWETVQNPTCTENGTKVRYCTCGEKQSESIAATGHTPGEVVIENVVDATCYSEGSYDSVICCSVCNAEIKTTITLGKLAHTVVIDAAVDATCTTTGLTEGKHCSICSEVIVEQYVIKMLGHNYVDGICTECGDFKYSKGLEFELNSDGASYTVTGIGSCTDTDIFIPSTYNGYPVTAIGEEAFEDCEIITSITIPDSVTTIGEYAFSSCDNLTIVTMPDSVTTLGGYAFSYCAKLKCNEYGNACYLGNKNNPFLVLIMAKDTSITDCTIHKNTKFVCSDAFSNCQSLTSVTIPDSVTSIGNSLFIFCGNLTSIEVSENNTTYKSIDGNLYTKDGKILIQYAIGKSDISFTIPDSVTTIGDSAFLYSIRLRSVIIPDSVTTIRDGAFLYCTSLKSVIIPDSVTTIGKQAFYFCYSLTSIEVSENNTAYESIDGNLYTKDGKILIQYAIGKSDKSFTIPNSVTTIGDFAFCDCSNLTSVIIGNDVTTIGYSAFSNCYSLTRVTIPNSVTTIGDFAFQGCTGLTSVTIGNGVTMIGNYAFDYCTSLVSVTFEDTTTWYRTSNYDDFIDMTGGEIISVKNPSDNATYFKSTYYYYYWYKK